MSQYPIWAYGVNVMQNIFAILQEIDLNGFIGRADDPILLDSTSLIYILFVCSVIFCGAGGEDLNDQIGRTVYTVRFNFIPAADNHDIGDKLVLLCQMNKQAIAKRNTRFSF